MRSLSRPVLMRGVALALVMTFSSSVYAQPNGAPPPPPGTESCPPPQTMGSDFRCHCPKGSDLVGGRCVSTACPRGQALNAAGQCEAIPVKPCPEGKERNAVGQCVVACTPPRKLDAAGRCA
jgi:hypothetical protein